MRTVLPDLPFVQRDPPVDGAWRIVQAARLVPKKGLSAALHAFAAFGRQYPEATFIIAGEGPLEEELRRTGRRDSGSAIESDSRDFFLRVRLARSLFPVSHFPSSKRNRRRRCRGRSQRDARGDGKRAARSATRHGGIPEVIETGKMACCAGREMWRVLLWRCCDWPRIPRFIERLPGRHPIRFASSSPRSVRSPPSKRSTTTQSSRIRTNPLLRLDHES